MGIENMGGPSVGFLAELPTPTVTYGAVMDHDDETGKMTGMKTGQMTGAMAGMDHANMPGMTVPRDSAPVDTVVSAGTLDPVDSAMMAMHMRMLSDTGIRRRLLADTALRRMTVEMLPLMPDSHRVHIEAMLRDTLRAPATPARRATPPRSPSARPAATPAKAPAKPATNPDPHAGHGTPPPAKPPAAKAPATNRPPPTRPTAPPPRTAPPPVETA